LELYNLKVHVTKFIAVATSDATLPKFMLKFKNARDLHVAIVIQDRLIFATGG